jgi:hypothetical protein
MHVGLTGVATFSGFVATFRGLQAGRGLASVALVVPVSGVALLARRPGRATAALVEVPATLSQPDGR